MNYINTVILGLLKKLPDWCTGKSEVFESGFQTRYGNRDCSKKIEIEKIFQIKCYFILILCVICLFLFFIGKSLFIQNKELHSLSRPDYGETSGVISLEAEVLHGEEAFRKKVILRVRPQSLTNSQKSAILKGCKKRLASEILGQNEDLQHIKGDLNLKRQDSQYPIQIDWSSNHPDVIEENGSVHRIGLTRPMQVNLTATLTLQNREERKKYKITVLPPKEVKELQEELSTALEQVTDELNKNDHGKELLLPSKLTKNTSIRWHIERGAPIFPLFILTLLLFVLLYKRRYLRMEKELQRYRESMNREYPEFINKVVLLLNAGLVITSALERIALDAKGKKEYPLMEAIGEISYNVRESNASFSKELKLFARRSGMREMMRFAAIVCDNLDKGSSLVEKLEAEGELLWMARKKNAEEEGRKAETKLILPLMVLLIILVVITISPVLIEI